jgi:peptidoglycan/xylan/chitin deacetylase (PgdA/CDA1 family)
MPRAGRILAELAKAGHEIASHSYSHPYDLVRLGREKIADELDRAQAAIAEACGRLPVGFRAPGYEITAELLDLLCERGYRYDSSAFPAIPYYLAKAAVMAGPARGRSQVGQHPGQSAGAGRAMRALPASRLVRPTVAETFPSSKCP